MNAAQFAIRGTGWIAVITGGIGLLYAVMSALAVFSRGARFERLDAPYFVPAYCIMAAISAALCFAVVSCGLYFVQAKTELRFFFVCVMAAEIVYVPTVGLLWLLPEVGGSIAAATGVANGGLSIQWLILFPFWGPLVAILAAPRTGDA